MTLNSAVNNSIQPLRDLLLIEPIAEQADSTLDLSMLDDKFPKRVRVLAKGPKVDESIHVNDLLLVSPFAGTTHRVDGQDVTFIKESDIRAAIE